ncbi:thiamine diphosphokinase [Erysipelothrix sp. HDW6C]|uniref:thiamine diphosphokinase n=1 Tax=Erysipelothrix sp. HDW6C TaxID=2714930 RepID=UPI00140B7215|nr:thiamine diphosphokinase [Erysipelothrix sp. HDW6C]QIK70225.1 thiamine diphosphokinase [Erysipelothrix sp. HDW6C]
MSKVTLVLGDFEGAVEGDVIGVDYGALVCINKGLSIKLACGDFDSVTEAEYEQIKDYADETIRLKPEKDDTDFYFAYKQCDTYDEILVVGGLGRRRDHEYTNIITAIMDSRITIVDAQNRIKKYDAGRHSVNKNHYQYFSVMVIEPLTITLEGFKYPLYERSVQFGDTYLTSNEIIGETGIMTLEGGSALIIQSNEIKKR